MLIHYHLLFHLIFMSTVLVGPIKAALLYIPITINYMEETQSVLVLSIHGFPKTK